MEPADTVKTYSIAFDDENNDVNSNINVVLDTKVDYFEPSKLKQGIYISRRALYSVTKRETKMYNFEESLYIPQGDYSDLFKTILNWSVLFVGIFGFIGVAIGFLSPSFSMPSVLMRFRHFSAKVFSLTSECA